ncbi:outer membrane beta-barrel protein [Rhodohalobacter sp.]|uniref:outer membrane beta-barrel protein n=1 Tax=Rhodohalobacter sp. TaxID=1974210 RepID=UPI0035638D9C
MKKLLAIIFATALVIGTSSITNTASAQTEGSVQEGDIKLGVGLAFGSGVGFASLDNDLGIRVDGYYAINSDIRAGADFTFYFPKSEGEVDVNVWELNLNGNYIFIDEDDLLVYGLGGINITGISVDTPTVSSGGQTFGGSSSDSEIGLNLGGGIEYALDFADLFGEIKLGGLGGDADQFVLGAGLRFPIN